MGKRERGVEGGEGQEGKLEQDHWLTKAGSDEKVDETLVSVHRLVSFFSHVYHFFDPPVHSVAYSVDDPGRSKSNV